MFGCLILFAVCSVCLSLAMRCDDSSCPFHWLPACLFIRHFNTFDSNTHRYGARHAHRHSLFLFAALVLVCFSSIAVAASPHTSTRVHTHTAALIDNKSSARNERSNTIRDLLYLLLFCLPPRGQFCSKHRNSFTYQARKTKASWRFNRKHSICMFFVIAEILCSNTLSAH